MMLSIVIPVYNREHTIGYCVDSILAQCNPIPYEIIVVNDGSTDQSLTIVQKHLNRCAVPSFVISQDNAGVAAARNAGKALARGDYVWFVDSDDVLPQGALRYLGSAVRACPVDILHFKARRVSSVTSEFVLEDCLPDAARPDQVLSTCRLEDAPKIAKLPVIGWNALYRRGLISNIRFHSFKQGEDYLFGVEAVVNAREVAVFDVVLYGYVFGHPSASIVRNEEAFLTIVEVMKRRLMVVESAGIPIGLKRAFGRRLGNELVQRIATNFERRRVSRNGWRAYFKTYYAMVVRSSCSVITRRFVGFLIWLPHSSHLIYFAYHCFRFRGWMNASWKRIVANCTIDKNQIETAQ